MTRRDIWAAVRSIWTPASDPTATLLTGYICIPRTSSLPVTSSRVDGGFVPASGMQMSSCLARWRDSGEDADAFMDVCPSHQQPAARQPTRPARTWSCSSSMLMVGAEHNRFGAAAAHAACARSDISPPAGVELAMLGG